MTDNTSDPPLDVMVALDPARIEGSVADAAAALVAAAAGDGASGTVGHVYEQAKSFALRAPAGLVAALTASPAVRSIRPDGADELSIRPVTVRRVE